MACEITAPTIRLKIHSHVECSHLGDLQQSEARACTCALTVSRAAAALQRRHGACAPDAHSGSHAHCRSYFDAHDAWLGARVCVGARTRHLHAPSHGYNTHGRGRVVCSARGATGEMNGGTPVGK